MRIKKIIIKIKKRVKSDTSFDTSFDLKKKKGSSICGCIDWVSRY